jgi:inward rectifier potassium channel
MSEPSLQQRGRVVDREGRLNIVRVGVSRGYLHDLYHFLLVSSWLRLLAILVALYVGSNALFACAYLLGDRAIVNARPGSFADAFFFSVQTMSTSGHGVLAPRTSYANVLMATEAFIGLLGLAMVTGMIFAKFSRPTARVLFSRVALMTRRDGVPCLMFRMANRRGNQIVEARVHVMLALTETTAEGEVVRRLHDLAMTPEQNALFALAWTAIHPITESSPLLRATPESLVEKEAEIHVSVTGLDETFSQTVHARYSYVPEEILWNARFVDIISRTADGRRQVDYSRFHDVVPEVARGEETARSAANPAT